MSAAAAAPAPSLRAAEWSLLAGNFAIGCGVMVVAGSLNDLVRSLGVSVAVGGQLISVAAIAMGCGAPLLAAAAAGRDRRRLLSFALVWFGAGHAIAAAAPDYATLLPLRALGVLGAAVFTPQAAAAIGALAPAASRGRAITFVFLGWSLASVIGMPLHSYVGEAFGWRWAFALVALFSLAAAAAVWRAMPDGVRPPPLPPSAWRRVLSHPVLAGIVLVTAASGSGQFTLFAYFAPYLRQQLGAEPAGVSALFLWFGVFGLAGNLLLARRIDRLGAGRAVTLTLAAMIVSVVLWPLAGSAAGLACVLLPWALAGFASNSAQQARASLADPALAPATLALNTSAIYLGQAIGAAGGGAIVAAAGYSALPAAALAWLAAAIALSVWVDRRAAAPRHG